MHDDVCIRLRNWDYTVKPWCHTPSSCYLLEVFMVEICATDQGAVSPIMLCCYNNQWLKISSCSNKNFQQDNCWIIIWKYVLIFLMLKKIKLSIIANFWQFVNTLKCKKFQNLWPGNCHTHYNLFSLPIGWMIFIFGRSVTDYRRTPIDLNWE